MAIRALDLMMKISSRFAYEILPVTAASVIGAMLVNHYGRQPISAPIIVQAPPSASEDAIAQSLREEHELIASLVKRDPLGEPDAERLRNGAMQLASVAPIPISVEDPPLPERRPRGLQKTVVRFSPKAAVRKKTEPSETPPQAGLTAVATETLPPPTSPLRPHGVEPEPAAQRIILAADAVGGWVVDVAQAPARLAFIPHWSDWSSLPSLIRPLIP